MREGLYTNLKCPVGKVPIGKVPVGKVPVAGAASSPFELVLSLNDDDAGGILCVHPMLVGQ